MQLSEIGDAIVGALPELSADLENYHAEWAPDEPGAYNISCDVLFPFLGRWLESSASRDQLRRTFSLLERLSQEPDQEVHFWVNDVVSWLVQHDAWLTAAQPFLGPRFAGLVRQHQDEVAAYRSKRRWWQFWR
jgi:hypothetical protein